MPRLACFVSDCDLKGIFVIFRFKDPFKSHNAPKTIEQANQH